MPSRTTMRTTAVFAFFISLIFTGLGYASTSTSEMKEYSHNGIQKNLPDLRKYPSGTPRKKAFLNIVVPAVDQHNQKIMQDRKWLLLHQKAVNWSVQGINRLKKICMDYKMTCNSPRQVNWNKLLSRVDIIPTHFVATQAAAESGWGTSELAQKNNNLFGMRCASCGKTKGKIKGYSVYPTIDASIVAYMKNLNTHRAYESLRSSRANQRTTQKPLNTSQLIDNLNGYSELGASYNRYLHQVFNGNKNLISEVQELAIQ
ncbi:protein bax [Xenorhabdus nematophila]|uniref:Protein bax n=1 Tax=Xenorhabdus nematophila (strain ATCC 19061 / DSM 3370 / CCUG 14189 / LMG 1036 / NCIMB 9965 / AN6) TaxID=406817 RepID=D3VJU9_XENNA|nr:protein bax [Xenorhabdus nematophila]CEE90366.1 Protein bax [Xenorhabdus nematophila str. Anatoliense]CBJ91008.1 Protein bax [Xenorhabdus nematophila ATCC 19061]CCW31874.1 Protein bax [Xenorhabdus nematophila F1]CEE91562.1 Protein bax [Xenorhabdus nematophila str. Anatoliense]CEK23828.1 Protein bax [Xenorhabdus nematophila AN6/1]